MSETTTTARDRECALAQARWAARRLATCEGHYFRAAVRHSRTGHERARVLRERWRRLAMEFGEFLEVGLGQLHALGLARVALELSAECGERIGRGRECYLAEERLDSSIRFQVPLAIQGLPSVARAMAERN